MAIFQNFEIKSEELLIREKAVSVHHNDFEILTTKLNKVQHGIASKNDE